jgi:predicted nucleic acid-binding protein
MSILLDSSVVIDMLRGNARALAFVEAQPNIPFVSPMTLTELHAGFRSQRDEQVGERVFSALRLASCSDLEICRRAGQHMKHYHPSHGLDDVDALIAATAEHHGLKLATINVKHFPMLKGLKKAY